MGVSRPSNSPNCHYDIPMTCCCPVMSTSAHSAVYSSLPNSSCTSKPQVRHKSLAKSPVCQKNFGQWTQLKCFCVYKGKETLDGLCSLFCVVAATLWIWNLCWDWAPSRYPGEYPFFFFSLHTLFTVVPSSALDECTAIGLAKLLHKVLKQKFFCVQAFSLLWFSLPSFAVLYTMGSLLLFGR